MTSVVTVPTPTSSTAPPPSRPRRSVAVLALLLVAVGVVACGGGSGSSDAARDWCTFADASQKYIDRFDLIFEAGLELGLPMDTINAQAAGLRQEYEAQGMDADAAVRAVSDELLKDPDFVAACELAYKENVGTGG